MVNYANSKVYKIWSTQGDKIYVGSTTKQYLSQRMDKHRSDYKRWKNDKTHLITSFKLFEEYGLDNCFIELLEAKDCKSKDELAQLEGKYIRNLDCVNRCVAGQTRKQYCKQYYEAKKDEIIENHKQYNEVNREKILEYQKQYHEVNKMKLSESRNQICKCECGSKYTHCNKAQHFKTSKHCQFIESQNKLIQ